MKAGLVLKKMFLFKQMLLCRLIRWHIVLSLSSLNNGSIEKFFLVHDFKKKFYKMLRMSFRYFCYSVIMYSVIYKFFYM